jgi:DNA-binding transcriptional ArsR family regulator
MAFSKAHEFDDAVHHFSLMCRSMAHPARALIVLKLLGLHGEKAKVGELAAGMPISLSTFSEHLKILREMSIVQCEVQHPYVYYSMNSALVNTYFGIFGLVTQAELKYDENYKEELKTISARRAIGTTPV